MTAYLAFLPLFDPLRQEERFQAVLEAIGWSEGSRADQPSEHL